MIHIRIQHEFWTQSMLDCCNQLNHWTIISKHIFLPNTTFHTLWLNAYQINSLMSYAVTSKLKLLISGTEQEQLDAEDLCQFFNHLSTITTTTTSSSETAFVKLSYIEKQYPFELATCFFYRKDFDRSKYYIQYAKDQFFLHWSQLSRLSEYGHDLITRDLFLGRIQKDLLSQWKLPDVIRSSISTWNDIVTNRGLFFDIVDKLINEP
ncbi:unnamed protein product [Rotaria magnacalcarata]|uniref:Uncharacterized protein n=1 Tax=Rotaria magnacalcarata TaxID=392030 RepID=A0A816Y4W4_9BILA|nr:unnamed protein product [Rotaria magnacalcarata]